MFNRFFTSSPSSGGVASSSPPHSPSPSLPPSSNGTSILKQSANGHVTSANSPPKNRRVSFYQTPNGKHLSNGAISGTVTSGNSSSGGWFRSIFGSTSPSPSLASSGGRHKVTSETPTSLEKNSCVPSIDAEEGLSFRPSSNAELLSSLSPEMTLGFAGRQLRLTRTQEEEDLDLEAALDATADLDSLNCSFSSMKLNSEQASVGVSSLTQSRPTTLDCRRVGFLLLNKTGSCGLDSTRNTVLSQILKKLLAENIMEQLPKSSSSSTHPLLRQKAPKPSTASLAVPELPSSCTSPLSAESRAATDLTRIKGVDLTRVSLSVFYSTLSEMIFGSIQLAPLKKAETLIDTRFKSGIKLLAFKLHHLGSVSVQDPDSEDSGAIQENDLFITSFIIDLEEAQSEARQMLLPLECGVAVLWLVPKSSSQPFFSASGPCGPGPVSELTLYDLLFNTPSFLAQTLQGFAFNLLSTRMSNVKRTFKQMLFTVNEFINGVRLNGDDEATSEEESIDSLVDLIGRLENREHGFFISNLLSTVLSYGYKQDRLKIILWSSESSKVSLMSQTAVLLQSFLAKKVHQISAEMSLNEDYQFIQTPPEENWQRSEFNSLESSPSFGEETPGGRSHRGTICASSEMQPVPGSSCSSTVSTITAIQVQAGGCPPSRECTSDLEPSPDSLMCTSDSRKSRDESIGYESLTESAFSGTVSPVNGEDEDSEGSRDSKRSRRQILDSNFINQNFSHRQANEASKDRLTVSQTTDYAEDDPGPETLERRNTTSTASEEENSAPGTIIYPLGKSQLEAVASLKKRENYFRGYVDLRAFKEEVTQQLESPPSEPLSSGSPIGTSSFPTPNLSQASLMEAGSAENSPTNDPNYSESHLNETIPIESQIQVQIRDSPYDLVLLEERPPQNCAKNSTNSRNLSAKRPSPASSPMYAFGWLSHPVLTTRYLDLVYTQVILGSSGAEEGASVSYSSLYEQIATKLRSEGSNDTVLLLNFDTWTSDLLERALPEPCNPVMSPAINALCERIHQLSTKVPDHKIDIWSYLRQQLTQLLLKSETLQSLLLNDPHLLLVSEVTEKSLNGEERLLETYLASPLLRYSRQLWAELIGDPNVGVYLTLDGPKAAFDLFSSRPPTSALYLFSDASLSRFYRPSPELARLFAFEVADIPVILGLRKAFLLSQRSRIQRIHREEGARKIDFFLKRPTFQKTPIWWPPKGNYIKVATERRVKVIPTRRLLQKDGESPQKAKYQPEEAITAV